jgi:hypothetical protein
MHFCKNKTTFIFDFPHKALRRLLPETLADSAGLGESIAALAART